MATPEQLHEAIRRADAAGDAEAVRALAAALKAGASKQDIIAQAAQNNLTVDEAALDANIASRDAGGQTNTFLPPKPATIGDGLQNAAATGAMAVADVYDFAQDVGKVPTQLMNMGVRGQAGLYDAVGLDGLADFMRRGADNYDRDLGRVSSVADLIDQASPAPEGMETARSVGRFAGGMMIPFGPKRVPRIQAPNVPVQGPINTLSGLVAEGAKRDVPVFTTDAKPPKSGMGKLFKQTIPEKIPFVGMSGPRAKQQAARQQAVADLVDEFGGDTGRALFDDSETATQQISKMLTGARGKRLEKLTARKDAVIDGIPGTVQTPNAIAAIDQQIARLSKLEADEVAPVIAKLRNWKDALAGRTTQIDTGIIDASGKPIIREIKPERGLRVIDDLRKLMGEAFNDPGLAGIKDIGQKAVNAIYGPLRDDMGNFIEQTGGKGARDAWQSANDELASMAGELKSSKFRNALLNSDITPERIGNILFNSPDEVSDLARVVSNLPPEGRRKVQGALLQRAWEKAGGLGENGVSVERFLNNVTSLSKKIGVAFEGEDRATLEGAKRLLESTRRAATAGVDAQTGDRNMPTILGVGATSVLGLAGGTATLGIGGLLARAYESALMRNMLLGLSRTKPGTPAESKMLERIMRTMRTTQAQTAANDTVGVSAAAGETEEQQ